uniref:Uncharacterized protein n=1 Tax=Astyanax mexicanus TaxID=7994 RepID=A0A3B1K9V9_ASTMX
MRWFKVWSDCSILMRNVTQEDQGEYICTYLEPNFRFMPLLNVWQAGYITRRVLVVIKDLSPTITAKPQNQFPTLTTPRQNGSQIKQHIVALDIFKNSTTTVQPTIVVTTEKGINVTTAQVTTYTSAILTSKVVEQAVNITQKPIIQLESSMNRSNEISELSYKLRAENDWGSSINMTNLTDQQEDFDRTLTDMTDHYRAVRKRDTKWKAYGFDSQVLQTADPWINRNLWFQQITHSVRVGYHRKGPCVVKVPAPGTWSSILEAIPEPLLSECQFYALSWLLYKQQTTIEAQMAISRFLFQSGGNCTWMKDIRYVNILDQQEDVQSAMPDAMEVTAVKADECICSNNTHGGSGMFMGLSECNNYVIQLDLSKHKMRDGLFEVTFQVPHLKQSRTVMAEHEPLPGNLTIGHFKDIWWVCGDKAYIFLPYGWIGCCYMATLKLPYEVYTLQKGEPSNVVQSKRRKREMAQFHNLDAYHWRISIGEKWGIGCCYMATLKLPYEVYTLQKGEPSNVVQSKRRKREMAQFHNLDAYHWRISIGEKWGIGLFPWYGVTFLADHIDNITYTLQGFANETIKGFEFLSNTQKSHRLTLLKHDMALDYILAKQGGLCVALNLTGDACYTLIPDSTDNVTNAIEALKNIRDAFGPSQGAGWSVNAWLLEKFGPMGALLVQLLGAALLSVCVMFCFCTLLLTCAKAMILRWIGVVMPGDRVQMPLLNRTDSDDDSQEESVVDGDMVEKYAF